MAGRWSKYQPAVIRIDAGSLDGAALTDTADNTWSKDYNFVGGNADKSNDYISAAADGAHSVYGTCRTGQNFQYGFTKADGLMPGGTYTLALHFAETYFEAAGARVFSVVVNGEEKIAGLDIFSRAGGKDVALVLHVPVTLGSDGVLSLIFFGTTDRATVAGALQFH
ncbi:hypothetical protein COCSUDRAFT_58092 [Coccomyxa subellipsoidea C-169]|uniref:Malectin domain-containing protein n=1 Tax=Coccomyxa subellipsoidea (strain C-169) TaxID=574566 RepID=I0YN86_COCSC|nr:hypothetical protein COCSUDRAFT_58092 [Coccomyxa subellipsoidea C-169]EIE19855.1 hypothetical protein COCSUDRAFT_58092 [Coccomyxa subellipsoidea C-169]|eukprot:XP_005644399.1 hypothetical protein COCSUDRAFT_58092 [Coccomyxa subellipsoidea C-169]